MSRIARPDAVSFARNGEEARPGGNRPRLGDTDPSRLWFSRGQQQMLDRLRAGVLAGTGVLFLTGDVGTGKTFLARALVHRLRADAIIATPRYAGDDPQDFWREVGEEWGIPGVPDTLEALYDGLTALLDGTAAGSKQALLFIDEAQGLNRSLLAEIGRLAIMVGAPRSPARLSILLVGPDQLGTVLSRPENAELAKRVGVRCVTEPFTQAEVHEYVACQLARDGRERAVFTGDGLRELVIASQGIPGLINSIVDLALLTSWREGTAAIGAGVVRGCVRRLGVDRPTPPRATPTTRMALPRRARWALLCIPALALLTALAVYVYETAWQLDPTREVNTNARPAAALVPASPGSSGSATPAESPRASEPGPSAAAGAGSTDGTVPHPVDGPPSARRAAAPPDAAAGAGEPGPSAAAGAGPPEGSVPRPADTPPSARSLAPQAAARATEPGPGAAVVPGPPEGSVPPAPVPAVPVRPMPRRPTEGTTRRSERSTGAARAAPAQVATPPTSSGARRSPEVQAPEESQQIDPGGIIDWLLSEYPARRQ